MGDYAVEQWVDYARGLLREPQRQAMSDHLSDGCQRCQRTAEVLGRLNELAEAERRYEPPAGVVRQALAGIDARTPAIISNVDEGAAFISASVVEAGRTHDHIGVAVPVYIPGRRNG